MFAIGNSGLAELKRALSVHQVRYSLALIGLAQSGLVFAVLKRGSKRLSDLRQVEAQAADVPERAKAERAELEKLRAEIEPRIQPGIFRRCRRERREYINLL